MITQLHDIPEKKFLKDMIKNGPIFGTNVRTYFTPTYVSDGTYYYTFEAPANTSLYFEPIDREDVNSTS